MKKPSPYFLLFVILVISAGVVYTRRDNLRVVPPAQPITSFEECAAAGYPIMESYPEQCATPDGQSFTRSIEGQEISVTGEIVCLPPKDPSGPQIMLCAYGLKTSDGSHYALRDPELQYITTVPMGEPITVTGILNGVPEDLSLDRYDIVGVIEISSVQE